MVPLPRQCPGVSGRVYNHFLPAKNNDPHRLRTSCRGKICSMADQCEEFHDWSDKKWLHVDEYLAKFSVQCEKEEKKTKASSSFFFYRVFPSMLVPLWVQVLLQQLCHLLRLR